MKTSLKSKLSKLLLGVTLGLGVAVGAAAGGEKAGEVKAGTSTYQHVFDAKPGTGNNVTLSGIKWTVSATQLNGYNSGNYAGVQVGAKSSAGNISLTSNAAFSYDNKSVIKEIHIWLNTGGSAVSYSASVGGVTCTSDGTTVTKNSTAKTNWQLTTDCKLTPNSASNKGVVNITASSSAGPAFYICAIQIIVDEEAAAKIPYTYSLNGAAGTVPTGGSADAGSVITLANAPSRSGFIFNGWSDGSKTYAAGATYTLPASGSVTFTAQWTAKTALQLAANNVNLKLGDSDKTVTVTAGGSATSAYTLSSGNTSAVTIVNNKLHVVGVGSSTITITKAEDNANTYTPGTFTATVGYADITSFELDYTEGTLGKGAETTLPGVTIEPANANQGYSWGDPVATEGIIYTYNPSTHELAIDANNAVEGTIQFTATASGDSSKTATVVYTVQAAQIANITGVTISVTGEIVLKQYVGDAFNAQGFSFAPTWSEGDHDVVEITADDISWNALVAGSNPTGTYSCADGEFTVTITGVTVVNDTLVSIAFSEGCDMTKKSYNVGESWDFSGLSIVGTMDSGKKTSAISSNVTFSSNDAVATTTTSITVTALYQGLTTAKTVTGIEVKEVTMTSLTVTYTGGKPYLGADFVFAGTIKGNMSNGTQQNVLVSDVDFDVNPYITTQQTVTATHKTTGATGTFNVQYQAKSYTSTSTEQKTLIVHASDVGGNNNSYALKDWTVGDVSGKSYTYASTSSASAFQFNGSKGTNIFYNTSAIPGKIKSVKMTKSSGSDRGGVEVFVHTSAMTSSNYTSGTSLGSKTVTTSGVTWDVPATNTNNNVYLYVHYPTTSALYVSEVEITYEKTTTVTSSEKHAIRIADVTCSKSSLIAGETISKSDFKIQVQYDTGTALTSNLTPTSVSPTTLVAGTNDYTITYTGSYNDTVTKVIHLTAQAPAVLESISITKDAGCDDVFTRNDTFTHNGIHVIAHYTDSTTYPDADVTANADITPPSDMNVAGTKTVNVSYEENDVKKTTSYQITVNPIVSTYLTLSGEGIEGSNGVYTLKSGIENEVQLSFDKDGDEEIEVTNPTAFLSFDKSTSLLTINSQTTTSESGTITFTAGSLTASLTVNVSAAEGIQLISDEEIVGYVGSSFSYNISIQLDNVESATWTLPQGDFVIESEIEDNTGFVGTIYFTDEVLDTLTFSVLTGNGKTLSVDIEVLAVIDNIKSISASLKSGVTYTAGQGQTFSKDDLTVKYVRDSGAEGTLLSSEFTVSGEPEGSFNRVASYPLTITSVENTEATCSLTINVGMPEGENLVTSTSTYVPGQPTLGNATVLTYSSNSTAGIAENDGFTTTGIKNNKTYNALLTSGSTITKQNAFTGNVGQITLNFNAWTATVGSAFTYTLIAIDSDGNETTYSTAGVEFYPTTSSTAQAAITVDIPSTNTKSITGWKISVVKGGDTSKGNCSFSDLSVSYKTWTAGQGTYNTTYSNNAMTATIYNFIAKANEVYASVCGSEGNNQKPDIETWRSVVESDEYNAEYNALVADTDSYNLLKSAICGEGAYGPDGVYVPSGEKQSSDMVIEFLQKYDRVVSNYPSENYNYLDRDVVTPGTAGTASALFKNMIANLGLDVMFNEENAPTSWVLLVTIAVAGLATGGYFYIRKRKED